MVNKMGVLRHLEHFPTFRLFCLFLGLEREVVLCDALSSPLQFSNGQRMVQNGSNELGKERDVRHKADKIDKSCKRKGNENKEM